jgi:2-iminobutanoate/2-iminopropanoate deaminase
MRNLKSVVGAAAIILAFSAAADAQKKDQAKPAPPQSATVEYQSASSPSARTLSDFVRVGNILYLSGKLGMDSAGNLVAGGIGPETKQTMENIKAVLDKNGSSMDNVIKCTVMLADIKEWADMNTVYTTFFKKERLPARSALGVSGLVRNARVEIECMATLK